MTKQLDERIYTRLRMGDERALEQLVATYGDALTRFAYCYVKNSATAEEMMEEAFVALWLKRQRLQNGQNLRAYLYTTVRNKCLDFLRFHRKRVPLEDYENLLFEENVEQTVLTKQRNRTLYAAMQTLPSQYGEVLYLVYFEGYSVEETTKILKKNVKQVYNLLSRAKSALKERLNKEGISHEDF